jgi:glutamate/tyrosine decarboxylase-like PLP-dependent enzyme
MIDDQFSALELAFNASKKYLLSLDDRPIAAIASPAELRSQLDRELPERGEAADVVIRELLEAASPGVLGSASGRFFAWVMGGTLPSALAADWLTSAWDQNGTLFASAPSAAVAEEVAGRWLKDVLGLPSTASFAFTTGCEMAHVSCLAAARHALLARMGWDVETKGLWGAPRVRVLSSTEHHGSLLRALRFVGFGTGSIEPVGTNDDGQIDLGALERLLTKDTNGAGILVLQAGDINLGAFDDFATAIPLARQHRNIWIHVDGAFGLWANATATHKHLTAAVQQADSWATDGHKWLNVPYDCGYAFVNDSEAHRGAMSLTAPYLTPGNGNRDAMDWTPEWSRRCRGFATYAAMRELGRDGIAGLVTRCCRLCQQMVECLAVMPGVELVRRPVLNQALVRFLDTAGENHDERTLDVVNRVNETGEAFFSTTVWRNRRCMRISICNWRTTESDVERAVAAFSRILR